MAAALMLGLAACGGGSSGSDESAPPAAPGPGPAPGPAPVATNSCQAFPNGTGAAVAGTLAGKATSPTGSALTYSLVTPPKSGTVTFASSSSGEFTYTRSSPARGDVDSFVYRVTDSAGQTAQATAEVIYGRRRIMPLGDSISDGIQTYLRTSVPPEGPPAAQRVGYRQVLRNRLEQEGYAVDFVGSLSSGTAAGLTDPEHEGHSGITQANVADSVSGWLAANPPDVVLLHIGTNDVYQRGTTSAAETSRALGSINAWAAVEGRPTVQLLLAKIISRRADTTGGSRDQVTESFNSDLERIYNTAWADAAAHPKFVVSLVDMNSRLNNTTDLTPAGADETGLHPNPTGYAKMGNAWFEHLIQTKSINKCRS
jgi:lysophospholipase L1-like esterase